MSVKDLVENIKHNGLLVSASLLEKLYTIAIENEKKLVAVTEQRDALVAENVVILQDRAVILEAFDDTCVDIGMRRGEMAENYPIPETPATSSAIAALRAEGVEMLAERRKKAADIARQRDDLCIADSLEGEAIRAQMFAKELREIKGESKL